jgi:hypothetical protein
MENHDVPDDAFPHPQSKSKIADTLAPIAVELAVEDLLARAEVELAIMGVTTTSRPSLTAINDVRISAGLGESRTDRESDFIWLSRFDLQIRDPWIRMPRIACQNNGKE